MRTTNWAERLLKVLDTIHGHLDDELTPEALARVCGCSLHHFHRIFRGMVGESVMGYVRRLRLERAAFRLKHAGGDVTSVALSFAYDSHEAFTRAFRSHFGVPPSVYRDSHERPHAPVAELRDLPARRLLTRSYVGPYEACGSAWSELANFAGALALPPDGPTVGLVYDDPEITPHERCRYEAGWPIATDLERALPAGFALRHLPAGRHAVALHRGPYSGVLDTYVALLGHWLPRRGFDLADEPVLEIYLNQPGTVPDAELLTEVCVRLA
jgi:AraC family transcriptional regulator